MKKLIGKTLHIALLFSSLAITIVNAKDIWISMGSDGYDSFVEEYPTLHAQISTLDLQIQGVTLLNIDEALLPYISILMHKKFNRCGGFVAHNSLIDAQAYLNYRLSNQHKFMAIDYTIDNASVVRQLHAGVSEQEIKRSILSLSAFRNRYYSTPTGKESAEW